MWNGSFELKEYFEKYEMNINGNWIFLWFLKVFGVYKGVLYKKVRIQSFKILYISEYI